jgi:3-deoxy-manno-octulosonate cytidylyltransferase (CMP-KDO synthetase)
MQFLSWGPSPIETIETIDMIRLLEHGQQVRMVVSPFQSIGVDTPEDLIVAKNMMSKDALFGKY